MDDLAPPEDDRQLALVAFTQKAADVLELEVQVMLVGLGPQLDLLDHHRRLVAPGRLLLLGRLVLELAEVHDPAYGGLGPRVDLYQLEPLFLGEPERFVGRHDSDLPAVGADDAYLGHPDAAPDAIVLPRGRGTPLIAWSCDALSSWLSPRRPYPPSAGKEASATSRRTISSSGVAGSCWPSRVRGDTARAAMSFSPTTSMVGIFSIWARRTLAPSLSAETSLSARSPAASSAALTSAA